MRRFVQSVATPDTTQKSAIACLGTGERTGRVLKADRPPLTLQRILTE